MSELYNITYRFNINILIKIIIKYIIEINLLLIIYINLKLFYKYFIKLKIIQEKYFIINIIYFRQVYKRYKITKIK